MASFEPISKTDERFAKQVLDAALRVHTQLGPGLRESVYEKCLGIELRKSGIAYESQSIAPITYDGEVLDGGLRLDLFVARRIVVELKAVDEIAPIHEAQLFTYLKLTDCRLGLLLNFNVRQLKDGIKRIVR